ncbi:energy-coupling factor transporter transmembrane component T [Limnochorda pilosa]|uniref:Cobalt ABC transporter permease n=1 Tax=Limnochorda pilosa TaxID=1555112 RepID=A0A0K2SGK5_LIMPI|nr:energy-coupling factor transporter transmembrane component T [Limnochorda pilosa]BAS26243.1 hypothetical protein LIP_0386 [Limnochorda pilosa]
MRAPSCLAGAGPLGRLGPLGLLTLSALGARLATVWLLAAATVLWVAWVDPGALRGLRSRWFMAFAIFLVVPLACWGGPRTWAPLPWLALSPSGLKLGLGMLGRSVVLWMSVATVVEGLSLTDWSALLERCGLKGFGFTLGVAFHMLPTVLSSAGDAWHALRMRGGLAAYGWEAPQLLMATVVSGALRHVDDIAAAAQARGYDPEKPRRGTVRVTGTDLGLVAAWAVACVVIRLGLRW